ncbi:MAG: hypothetical protein AB7E70_20810 [Hyphomicrobiaceae bacterium]
MPARGARRPTRIAISGVLAILATSPAVARPCTPALDDIGSGLGATRKQLHLERVTAREIYADSTDVARTVRSLEDLARAAPRRSRIVRRIDTFWQRKLPATVDLARLRVEHRLVSRGGALAGFAHTAVVDRVMPFRLIPLPPVVVCTSSTYVIVSGGVVIELMLDALPAAGRYHVDIETIVEQR